MSRVTNAIITAGVAPKDRSIEIDAVNKFLKGTESGGGGEFREISEHSGGTKHMECRVYLSTLNHADTDAIVVAVEQAPWREREMVQLFLKEQEEELFSLRYCGSAQQQPAVRGFFKHELEIINNALNEVCNGVQLEGEFETRMGCSLQEPQSLLAKVHALAAK